MALTQRRYKLMSDFAAVHRFLTDIYSLDTLNSYLLPPFFEYAHTHPMFNHKLTHRFGLWEDDGNVVGLACYEMDVGEVFLVTDEKHAYLLVEMVNYAEKELSSLANNQRTLAVWITDKESDKISLLEGMNYTKVHTEAVRIFPYNKPFLAHPLPDGFSVLSLEDENDLTKINDCLWKGFNHGDDPDDDIDCRLLMQSGPNFRKDLTTIIKAPTGEYACFAGMWFDEKNRYAYLEPLATVPAYRRRGLAAIALTEAMKKTKALEASYCFGGAGEFYAGIGFELIGHRQLWKKQLD